MRTSAITKLAGLAALTVATAALAVPGAATAAPPGCQLGTTPSFCEFGVGQLSNPVGLAADKDGNVYVADSGSSRVVVFDDQGGIVTTIGPAISGGTTLQTPTGVAVEAGSSPGVFVADAGSGHVQGLGPGGNLETDFGAFQKPTSVDVDAAGDVFVTDAGARTDLLIKFSGSGELLNVYGKPGGGAGSGAGEFDAPADVDIDSDGDTVVADTDNERLQKLGPTGEVVWQTAPGALVGPAAVDNDIDLVGNSTLVDRVWTAESAADRFTELDDNGAVLSTHGSSGTGVGQFSQPQGLTLDCADNLFISDTGNNRIQRYGTNVEPPCFEPANTTSPKVVGTAAAGSGLALDPGAWTGNPPPRLSYRWQRCSSEAASTCKTIAGARSLTYAVGEEDRGFRLRALVVAANDQGVITEPTDMTRIVPAEEATVRPPAPPSPAPLPPGPAPLPQVEPSKAERSGPAGFRATCSPDGETTCRVTADLLAPADPKLGSRAGILTLATARGHVSAGETEIFKLKLKRKARKLIKAGYDERAVMRVFIDGERALTSRIRVFDGTIGAFER